MYQLDLGTTVHLFRPDGLNKEFYESIKEIKRQGFKSIELSLGKVGGYKVNMEQCIEKVGDGIKAVLDEGLILNSIHMPFQRFIYISSYDEDVRAFALDAFCKLIEECDKYNPNHYVFHSKTKAKEAPFWELRKPALTDTFRRMIATTKNNICIENMVTSFPDNITDMVSILEEVEGGKCCIDMNHFLHDKVEDAISALGKWLCAVHVSDYDGIYEKHWMPKEGVNDWMKIIGALEKVGYKGAFTYELLREKYGYTYADIRKNYEMLFEEYNKTTSR
ncbi:MAG: sugar phosphate isomerase/epimerase [Clostridia bacterium]|nr:sugar phosphate isomerase/epimerase [Clostridia bacterium]